MSVPMHIGIAIVGAGPGGLVAARVLQNKGLDVAVFEREASRASRGQGGVLDLHPESGQWALIEAGLEAQFRALARAEGQDMRILDRSGKALWEEVSPPDLMARPEVDRPALREVLLDSLRPGTILWDHQLVGVEPLASDGRHALRFANGSIVTADVVVGADGARSQVRPLLTDARPLYTGVSFLEIGIPDAERTHPACARTVGRGSCFALADDKGVIAQRNGDGRIRIYVAFRMAEGDFPGLGIPFGDPAATRSAVASQFEGWAPEIVALLQACDDTFLERPIHAMPVGVRWPSKPGVTLLGDAAHQMSPFAGAGANLAMQDGAELALSLVEAGDRSVGIARYEQRMFARAEEAAAESSEGLELCISPNGAERFAQQMRDRTRARAHSNVIDCDRP
jgi:2-polyprenyl-6-methoxyphenol hydroxylase-like FAD-dependent oxidoreductase